MTIQILFSLLFLPQANAAIDCSEAYNGKPASCERTVCDEKYKPFLGTWAGPFEIYVQELSTSAKPIFRSFQNTITYSEADCLKHIESGDTFIIGRRADHYPAFQGLPKKNTTGLLITGKHADGSPFLRTVDRENGASDYQLEYQNKVANLSVWSLTIPASSDSPQMKFTTIYGRDFNELLVHKRNVTVTMTIGPKEAPLWEGIVSKGYHSLIRK